MMQGFNVNSGVKVTLSQSLSLLTTNTHTHLSKSPFHSRGRDTGELTLFLECNLDVELHLEALIVLLVRREIS